MKTAYLNIFDQKYTNFEIKIFHQPQFRKNSKKWKVGLWYWLTYNFNIEFTHLNIIFWISISSSNIVRMTDWFLLFTSRSYFSTQFCTRFSTRFAIQIRRHIFHSMRQHRVVISTISCLYCWLDLACLADKVWLRFST